MTKKDHQKLLAQLVSTQSAINGLKRRLASKRKRLDGLVKQLRKHGDQTIKLKRVQYRVSFGQKVVVRNTVFRPVSIRRTGQTSGRKAVKK